MISIISDHPLPSPLDRLDAADRIGRKLERGEVLFTQDQKTGGLYYLVAGTIDLTRVTQSGDSVLIHRARERETFAEASLFSSTYHCTATAACKSTVIECRRCRIDELLLRDAGFTHAMASRFAMQIQQSRRLTELLRNTSCRRARADCVG